MKKLSLKKELLVMIMLAVLLTGCGDDVQTEELLQLSFAKMTLLDTKPELDGNVLLYGNLRITLPEGVIVEQQEPEGDSVVIDLAGAESVKGEEGYRCFYLRTVHFRRGTLLFVYL